MVAQGPLEAFVMVRIHVGQPLSLAPTGFFVLQIRGPGRLAAFRLDVALLRVLVYVFASLMIIEQKVSYGGHD